MVTVTLEATMRILHLMTAGIWAGWTVFMAVLVVPGARDGRLDPEALRWLTGQFSLLSKGAPLVTFVTGTYMVGQGYTTDALLYSSRGTLVLTMIGLWLVLSGVTNLSSRRLTGCVDEIGVERAARDARAPFAAAGVVALALLLVGGWL
ncbi:hypothetical protein [Halorarum salinum]|uniref:Copper resistance protein D domain-containing protein n=1 Tax=Halorarum salinum TaxID=2743089 RepID=A0A7D5Q8K4_9EURY|nr:hypothetical protein [Halobaculum salinum]QLG60258.1 hypothetical protein HUG12_00145 [Halobaculum salinum]